MPELSLGYRETLIFHLLQSSASTKIFVFPQLQEMISSYFLTLKADFFPNVLTHFLLKKSTKTLVIFSNFIKKFLFIFIYTTWINKNTYWLLSQLNK